MATKTVQSRILGPDGEPIRYEVLEEEISAGGVTGIRQVWHSGVTGGLTPPRLAQILEAAANGDAYEYLCLAEEMEERDLHYASVLGTRKLALSGLQIRVDAWSDDKRDVEIADAVREMLALPAVDEALFDLTDGLGKGYSVIEIVWDRSGKVWMPATLEHRDPRFFRYDRETGHKLRLLDDADPVNGIPLAPFKFVVHRPKIRSGLPVRGGLARLAAPAYMCKAWAWKDWMAFADIFGLPMRVGRYGPGATKEDIVKLMAAVANLGSDAAAVMPDSTRIEFQAAPNTNGAADFFEKLATWWDKQVSKGVLGQTMTADDGASLSQAKVHNDVRLDLLQADAKALQTTLNRDLVRPFVDLNFGPGRYPKLIVQVPESEDIAALTGALEKLVPMGLRVEQSVIRDKLGLPDPDEGAELLTAPAVAAPAPPAAATPARTRRAENREGAPRDREDQLVALLASRADPVVGQWVERIEALVQQAGTLEEVRDGLLELMPDLDSKRFAAVLQHALAIAGIAGMSDAVDDADT
ncbi:DUF935 domain-containing protein [Vulcaniibacterium tengchongense]|uniref:Phage gp29-like protein n=1 Tax=Vulcaniibacterium tengchongense TaxID=1273429 RepID=A0A3N4VXI9_9GAMM|nr:DUF935 domain-containing protein [Vulcaniibacterium tengchongense]RPE81837.1 phage gp29-like protein [Vulcaniibacterium tengchongense]